MKKKLFLCISCLLAIIPTMGMTNSDQPDNRQMTVWLANGEKVAFLTSEKPEFQLHSDTLTVISMRVKADFLMADIDKFSLEESEETGIRLTKGLDGKAETQFTDGAIVITNAHPGEQVTVVSLNGIVVASPTIGNDGKMRIDLTSLGAGTYIIQIGQTSIKFHKR